jgi:hypothetical protein
LVHFVAVDSRTGEPVHVDVHWVATDPGGGSLEAVMVLEGAARGKLELAMDVPGWLVLVAEGYRPAQVYVEQPVASGEMEIPLTRLVEDVVPLPTALPAVGAVEVPLAPAGEMVVLLTPRAYALTALPEVASERGQHINGNYSKARSPLSARPSQRGK